MPHYIGLIHKDPGSDYSICFPDFPGCVTAGSTLAEARTFAEEALSFHIQGMIEDGDAIPKPSRLEVIMADPENREAAPVLVAVKNMPRVLRVSVTLPEDVLAEIDQFAGRHGLTRSGFLVRAAKRALDEEAA